LGGLTEAESADFTQLGVNSDVAIRNGGLADNPLFFGSATSEILSANDLRGSWNRDQAYPVISSYSFFTRGGPANYGTDTGAVAFSRSNGVASATAGHRTILSGY
jgi:hypothetical protein